MSTESQLILKEKLDRITDAFLRWELPESVCSDLCVTKQGKGRTGTNLLTFTEAKQMFRDLLTIEILVENALDKIAWEKKAQEAEDSAMFIKRLVRQSYKLGKANKLTKDAMNHINNTMAACSPLRKLMDEVMPEKRK